jgi:hypothetical protein
VAVARGTPFGNEMTRTENRLELIAWCGVPNVQLLETLHKNGFHVFFKLRRLTQGVKVPPNHSSGYNWQSTRARRSKRKNKTPQELRNSGTPWNFEIKITKYTNSSHKILVYCVEIN